MSTYRKEVGRYRMCKYHLVERSPWPLLLGLGMYMTACILLYSMQRRVKRWLCVWCVWMWCSVLGVWIRDVIREGTYIGEHTKEVSKGLLLGFVIFVISEVMLFVGVIGSYLWSGWCATIWIGGTLPIEYAYWYKPFVNTICLLTSGGTITLCHRYIEIGDRRNGFILILWTILLGLVFLLIQVSEYIEGDLTFADGIYGSTFYLATGLHGLHVIVGTIMLGITLGRWIRCELTPLRHSALLVSAWYWHFVDVVWLLLFILVYITRPF